jgi:serine protease Do
MQINSWSRRRVCQGAVAAILFTASGIGIIGNRPAWADEPIKTGAGVVAKQKPTSPLLDDRTSLLAEMENGFAAIAERIGPSVVSIEVVKKVKASAISSDFDRLFRQFDDPNAPDKPEKQDGKTDKPDPNKGTKPPRVTPKLQVPQEFNTHGSGSGVIVRADGWILTNDHVVDGADKVTVTLHDGRVFIGTVRRDFRSDLAVVKIDATDLPPIEFADSDRVRVGQWAVAFGSPFELNDTMTVGIISARQRQKTISEGREIRFYPSLLQTDASINPGNSGGALVDVRGQLIGINVAIGSPNGGNVGIAFAIPSNSAREVMQQLVSSGKVVRGFLGVQPVSLTPVNRKNYGVSSGGALVEVVNDDTPAAAAGLQVEDVIIRFDGKPVADDISLRSMVARTTPETKVNLVIMRDGHEQTITATVGALPTDGDPSTDPAKPADKPQGKIGIEVEKVNAENTKDLHLPATATGLVVTQVDPTSPAAEVGIRKGDVISRVNGRSVSAPGDLQTAMQVLQKGEAARLVVQRGKARILVNVPMS